MSYPAAQGARMKTSSTRSRRSRSTLMPVPYSFRPDRLERGIRLLRALRLSLAAQPPVIHTRQCEFDFVRGTAVAR
jgi:hypothetical protein